MLQHLHEAEAVDGEIAIGVFDGILIGEQRGEVEDALGLRLECARQRGVVGDAPVDESRSRRDQHAVTRRQIVEDRDLVTARHEFAHEIAADRTSAAGDENSTHGTVPSSAWA